MTLMSKVKVKYTYHWFIGSLLEPLFHFVMKGVHIWKTVCLWYGDNNEGFRLIT